MRVPPAAPSALLLLDDAPGRFGKGGNALDAPPLGQRVPAGPGQLAVGEGQLAGFGERDEPDGAESEFAPSSADDEPLDPASRALGLDVEEQAVPVGVASRRRGTDEGGREGLFGMAASVKAGRRRTLLAVGLWNATAPISIYATYRRSTLTSRRVARARPCAPRAGQYELGRFVSSSGHHVRRPFLLVGVQRGGVVTAHRVGPVSRSGRRPYRLLRYRSASAATPASFRRMSRSAKSGRRPACSFIAIIRLVDVPVIVRCELS